MRYHDMKNIPLKDFGATATGLARNPLGIIALFIVLVYGLACLVVITGSSLSASERLPMIYFLVIFPVAVLGVFTYLVAFRSGHLFAPRDFRNEENYVKIQEMRLSAVASLAVAKQTKDVDRSNIDNVDIEKVVSSVESAVALAREGTDNPRVLWVDDNPNNNIFERKALEAVGIEFTLSKTTADALNILSDRSFGAIISDMGRREGSLEGYVLLDAIRARGDETPLFFYASSNSVEHKRETREHGGQDCTNDGRELFDMVTRVIFGSQPARKLSSRK
jgi:CheY-like chemotaxis protein